MSIDQVAEGTFSLIRERVLLRPGANLTVIGSQGDGQVSVASTQEHVESAPLSEVFCGAKPIVALGSAAMFLREGIELDTPVGALLPRLPEALQQVTIGGCLSHEIRALGPSGLWWQCRGNHSREIPLPEPTEHQCYSEVLGGATINILWDAVMDVPHERALCKDVLAPLGLSDSLLIDGPTAEGLRGDRVEPDWAPTKRGWVPMLHALVPAYRLRTSAAFNGWANAWSLHSFIRAALVEAGPFVGVGQSLLVGHNPSGYPGSGRRYDGLLTKNAGFRLGFVVVDETDGLPELATSGVIMSQAGLSQKVVAVAPQEGLVLTAVTDATLVPDAEYTTFRDTVLQSLDQAAVGLSL